MNPYFREIVTCFNAARAGSLNRFRGALNRGDSKVNRRCADGAPQLLYKTWIFKRFSVRFSLATLKKISIRTSTTLLLKSCQYGILYKMPRQYSILYIPIYNLLQSYFLIQLPSKIFRHRVAFELVQYMYRVPCYLETHSP